LDDGTHGGVVRWLPHATRPSLHQEIVALLRDLIVEGKLLPGARIAEPQLCKQLGVSRTPLREALKVLAAEQLIVLLPNRGAEVARVSVEETAELFEIMGALELLIGELVAPRLSGADLAALEEMHRRLVEHRLAKRRSEYYAYNQAIHLRLCELSGNAALKALYRDYQMRIARVRHLANLSDMRWEESLSEHEAIMSALRSRDPVRLGQTLRDHLRNTQRGVIAVMNESALFEKKSSRA
jgi:DNA-binding GntR family transcriptional regulator